jgi:membrane associated rhomboid family serine protease
VHDEDLMGPQRMYGLTTWVRRLLVANLLVFLVQNTLFVDSNFTKAFAFTPLAAWSQPWTFVTYMFLHAGILHLAFNMLVLFVFGSSVEERMGGGKFFLFYILCGIGGAAASFLLMQAMRVTQILGASGAVLGVAVAFAWYWPDHPVFVFPLPDPIPAKWLVVFLVGMDLVLALLRASDGTAHLAHLGGVATALLYLKGQDWYATRGERRGRQLSESSVLVSQPPRVSRGSGIPPSARAASSRGGPPPDARATAEIDRVLDKIIASGVDSLTPAERKFLTEISRRLRTPPKA